MRIQGRQEEGGSPDGKKHADGEGRSQRALKAIVGILVFIPRARFS